MSKVEPVTVVAKDVRELKRVLTKVPAGGVWLVERGPFGHASILCYDAQGNLHTTVRNKP
jgi:hypothetical protein